ncbi:calcium binding EGF domain protein, partial [Cooperia oncophora]
LIHFVTYFVTIQLEQHKDCIYDRVVLWESSESGAPLATLCGVVTGRQIVTRKSNQMVIRLISDNSVQKSGFELSFVRELDECASGTKLCEQRCVNTVGSYRCDCHVGYSLRPDGRTCE